MKKILLWILCLIGLAGVTGATTIGIMSSVHEQSFKDELFDRFPVLEQIFDKEETSKDDDIVIEDEEVEDETQTEENGESTDPVEDPTE